MNLETPILFCVFNRPDLSSRVFEAIARQRPRKLFLACDGPRDDRPDDARLVAETRAIFDQIDWPCQVERFFRTENHGCRRQMSDAISWGFEKSERLIILEDDCLPDPSFFPYCETLLDRFEHDNRIAMISGDNFQPHQRTPFSYYFSTYSHIWGWASWRRAWKHFDLEVKSWPTFQADNQLACHTANEDEIAYWTTIFDRQFHGPTESWAFSWAYACWKAAGLTVLPERNLVSNIGFRDDGTHTVDPESMQANRPTESIGSLNHPSVVARNRQADEFTWESVFCPPIESQGKRRNKRLFRKRKSRNRAAA